MLFGFSKKGPNNMGICWAVLLLATTTAGETSEELTHSLEQDRFSNVAPTVRRIAVSRQGQQLATNSVGTKKRKGNIPNLKNMTDSEANFATPEFNEAGRNIQMPQNNQKPIKGVVSTSSQLDPNIVKIKLQSSHILRDNLVNVLGYLLYQPVDVLSSNLYSSLFLIHKALRMRQVNMLKLVEVSNKLISLNLKEQLKIVFKELQAIVPKYLEFAVTTWTKEIKKSKNVIDDVLKYDEKLVSSLLFGMNQKDITFLNAKIPFGKITISKSSQLVDQYICQELALILTAITDRSLTVTQPLFGIILLHLPTNEIIPQREEAERFLEAQFRISLVEPFNFKVKPEVKYAPYALIADILIDIAQSKISTPAIRHAVMYLLPYINKQDATFFNPYHNSMLEIVSTPTVNFVQLLNNVIRGSDYPSEIIELRNRIVFYIVHRFINIDVITESFRVYAYDNPIDIIIAILTKLEYIPKLNPEILASIKALQMHLTFQRLHYNLFLKTPSTFISILQLVQSFNSPELPLPIRTVSQDLTLKLEPQRIDNNKLAKLNSLVEHCSHVRDCFLDFMKKAIDLKVITEKTIKEDIKYLIQQFDANGNLVNEDATTSSKLPSHIKGTNFDPNITDPYIVTKTNTRPTNSIQCNLEDTFGARLIKPTPISVDDVDVVGTQDASQRPEPTKSEDTYTPEPSAIGEDVGPSGETNHKAPFTYFGEGNSTPGPDKGVSDWNQPLTHVTTVNKGYWTTGDIYSTTPQPIGLHLQQGYQFTHPGHYIPPENLDNNDYNTDQTRSYPGYGPVINKYQVPDIHRSSPNGGEPITPFPTVNKRNPYDNIPLDVADFPKLTKEFLESPVISYEPYQILPSPDSNTANNEKYKFLLDILNIKDLYKRLGPKFIPEHYHSKGILLKEIFKSILEVKLIDKVPHLNSIAFTFYIYLQKSLNSAVHNEPGVIEPINSSVQITNSNHENNTPNTLIEHSNDNSNPKFTSSPDLGFNQYNNNQIWKDFPKLPDEFLESPVLSYEPDRLIPKPNTKSPGYKSYTQLLMILQMKDLYVKLGSDFKPQNYHTKGMLLTEIFKRIFQFNLLDDNQQLKGIAMKFYNALQNSLISDVNSKDIVTVTNDPTKSYWDEGFTSDYEWLTIQNGDDNEGITSSPESLNNDDNGFNNSDFNDFPKLSNKYLESPVVSYEPDRILPRPNPQSPEYETYKKLLVILQIKDLYNRLGPDFLKEKYQTKGVLLEEIFKNILNLKLLDDHTELRLIAFNFYMFLQKSLMSVVNNQKIVIAPSSQKPTPVKWNIIIRAIPSPTSKNETRMYNKVTNFFLSGQVTKELGSKFNFNMYPSIGDLLVNVLHYLIEIKTHEENEGLLQALKYYESRINMNGVGSLPVSVISGPLQVTSKIVEINVSNRHIENPTEIFLNSFKFI